MISLLFFAWLSVAMLSWPSAGAGWVQADQEAIINGLKPSIVTITSYDQKNNIVTQGTGFFTNKDGEILTRRSLINDVHHSEVTTQDGKKYRVLRMSYQVTIADLARIVIDIDRKKVTPLVYKAPVAQVNEEVFVLGGVGNEKRVVAGTVAAVEDSSLGSVIRVNATLTPQMNGGPVFNSKGELVGIALLSTPGASSFIANSSFTNIMPPVSEQAVDQKPKQLNIPTPSYTEQARRNGVEGSVLMRILIGTDGDVKRANVVRGLPLGLDDEALKAVYKLKFKPAMKAGNPVQYWMSVIVEFKLRKDR